jgi:hypothetical protein
MKEQGNMKKLFIIAISFAFVLGCLVTDGLAQKKLAQTGFQFLSVGTDARATGMGEAFTTMEGSSASLFYNPAGMARVPKLFEVVGSRTTWIADIEYLSGSMALRPWRGKYGVLGISFMTIDYGVLQGTVVADNEQGFIETGNFSPSAHAIGVGYANDLTDRFAVGGQVKLVSQSLGNSIIPVGAADSKVTTVKNYAEDVLAFDFGTLYKTGFKSLTFGMCVRNFSQEVKYEREGFQLPLTFKVGFSMNVLDFVPSLAHSHALNLSIDAAHPRDFPEYLNMGAEYLFLNKLALRAGYITQQDDYGFTAGFGLNLYGMGLDYSYTPFDVFQDINRFSVKFNF